MKRMNITIPDDLYEKLRKYAFDKRTSMSAVIQELLKTLFEDTKIK